jgi:glycosyltransferase involved in cell wall biosynthesis
LVLAHESAPFPVWPQVSVVHDLTILKSFSGRLSALQRLQHWFWVLGLRRSRWIVCISDKTRDDLLAHYPKLAPQVVTVYEGVDKHIFCEADSSEDSFVMSRYGVTKPYLLYAGTLAPHKNVEFLIPVLAGLRRRHPDLALLIVGKYDQSARNRLLRIATECQVADRILLLGYVSDNALAALMRQCAAFVFPSLNEGFGLAPVEAMSCGAPVIASAAGSLPEVIGDGAVLIRHADKHEWVVALDSVLADSTVRSQLRARGLTRAATFSWASAARGYVRLLESHVDSTKSVERQARATDHRRRTA